MTCQRTDAHTLGDCPDYTTPIERSAGEAFPADYCRGCGATGSTPHWAGCRTLRGRAVCPDCALRWGHDGPCLS